MDRLLLCESCGHGVTGHAATGCEVANCRCTITGERILADAIRLATEETREQYREGDRFTDP